MLGCPECGGTYHAAMTVWPWCRREGRPPILRCDIHGHLPAGRVPGTAGEARTGGSGR